MVRRFWGPLVGAALAACLAPSVAGAHILSIDSSGGWQSVGAGCNPCQVNLGFSIGNSDGTLTNSLYVYSNGVIAVGRPFSSMPDLPNSSPADSPLFAVGFNDTSFSSLSSFDYSNLSVATYTPSANDEFVIFPIVQADGSGLPNAASVEFQPIAGGPGAFSMTFNLGVDSSTGYLPFDWYDLPDCCSASNFVYPIVGYDYGGGSGVISSMGQTVTFDFLSGSSAPEPSTWVELMIGLGLLGGAFRLRSNRKLVVA